MSRQRRRPLRWTIGLVATIVLVVLFAPTTVGGATSYVIVSGSSMEPTLDEGDLVVVRQGQYEVGDIVAFQTGNGLVIHRIVDGSAEGGFVMQGDNKTGPDTWSPLPDEIVGEYFAKVPLAGRWVHGLASNPAWFGALVGGLGSLMIWSPRRRRRGTHTATASGRRLRPSGVEASVRRDGATLIVFALMVLLLGAATVWLMLRPLERIETVDRILFEHEARFAYSASVEPSVVYDSDTVSSPSSGSDPTALYTQLLDQLLVEFRYRLESPAAESVHGTIDAELRIGAGEELWTRTVPLLGSFEFNGSSTSTSFPVDVSRVLAMVNRAEEETGFSPGTYQLAVAARVRLEASPGEPSVEFFEAVLPMELRGTLLTIVNENLAMTAVTSKPEERLEPHDIDILGLSVSTRSARATVGALLAMALLGGVIHAIGVRRRLGSGELARIRLRYGSLIVPVSETTPNGEHAVEVKSMSDLVRLARRAEQMVFHQQDATSRTRFFVPDGAVVYEFRPSGTGRETR